MSKVMTFLEVKVAPAVNKIGSQRHLRAVRNGIISMLPLTIVGSFFVIFLNVPIPGYDELIAPIKASLDIPFRYTVGIMSIYVAFGIAFQLAKSYNLDELTSGFLAVSGFLISSEIIDKNKLVNAHINICFLFSLNNPSALIIATSG